MHELGPDRPLPAGRRGGRGTAAPARLRPRAVARAAPRQSLVWVTVRADGSDAADTGLLRRQPPAPAGAGRAGTNHPDTGTASRHTGGGHRCRSDATTAAVPMRVRRVAGHGVHGPVPSRRRPCDVPLARGDMNAVGPFFGGPRSFRSRAAAPRVDRRGSPSLDALRELRGRERPIDGDVLDRDGETGSRRVPVRQGRIPGHS